MFRLGRRAAGHVMSRQRLFPLGQGERWQVLSTLQNHHNRADRGYLRLCSVRSIEDFSQAQHSAFVTGQFRFLAHLYPTLVQDIRLRVVRDNIRIRML
jgi:hypothetical protein